MRRALTGKIWRSCSILETVIRMKGDPIYIKQILRADNPTANVGIRLVQPRKREVVRCTGPVSGDPTCAGQALNFC
jgi:hypothetical protein